MNGDSRHALYIAAVNGAVNAVLAILKITVGTLSCSKALISDGLHSVTDVVATIVVMIGIGLSRCRADDKYPYGCERLECVAAVLVSVVIAVTGGGIAIAGVSAIRQPISETAAIGTAALWTAVLSVVVKEIMFRYTKRWAKRAGSSALEADAWHQRTDALSSVGSLVGIIGAQNGLTFLDPLASIVIGALIVKSAVMIFAEAMRNMTDRACDDKLKQAICRLTAECDGVMAVEKLKTRLFADRVCAEITVSVDRSLSCEQAYAIAQAIGRRVTENLHRVKLCSVHIQPM